MDSSQLLLLAQQINSERRLLDAALAEHAEGLAKELDAGELRELEDSVTVYFRCIHGRINELVALSQQATQADASKALFQAAINLSGDLDVNGLISEAAAASVNAAPEWTAPLSVAEIAKKFKRHRRTINRWLKDGSLPHRKITGGSYQIPTDWQPAE